MSPPSFDAERPLIETKDPATGREPYLERWPKLLRNVPQRYRGRLLASVETGAMTIPAGTRGVITRGTTWERFSFHGDPCPCCQIRARVHSLSRHAISLPGHETK